MDEMNDAARPSGAPRRAYDRVQGSLRRLYDWVLHWAETPYGAPALLLLAVCESVFFPIPPDILLIALAISLPNRALYYAGVCAVGSVVGGCIGYALGWLVWEAVSGFFFAHVFPEALYLKVGGWLEQYDFWIVFAAGFTPIPYKVFTLTSGAFHEHIRFVPFLVASTISRSARFFLVAGLIYLYGEKIRDFIDRRFNQLTIAFTALFVGGFAAIKYLM